jgi:hypothetical protein
MMLLTYLLLGAAALAVARAGAALFFAVLTLPTALNLAASFNQDPLLIACCVLAAALLTRGDGPARFAALVPLTAAICAKTPYAPLLLFCLPPLAAAGAGRRGAAFLLAGLLPALWLLHISQFGFMDYAHPHYHPGPLWPGPRDIWLSDVRPAYNLYVLLARPLLIVTLPLWSVGVLWPLIWRPLLGMVGCDHGLLPAWEYPCLILALVVAVLGALQARLGWRAADAALAALALFAAFIAVELSLYLTYDTAGVGLIIGVQSRYYLPFIPFLLFPLGWAGERMTWLSGLSGIAPGWFCLPAMAMALVNAVALPLFIFHLYRMAGPS